MAVVVFNVAIYLLSPMDLLFRYYQHSGSLIWFSSSVSMILFSLAAHIHIASIFHAAVQLEPPELCLGSPFALSWPSFYFSSPPPSLPGLINPGSSGQGWRNRPCRTPRPCCTYLHFTHRSPSQLWRYCALTIVVIQHLLIRCNSLILIKVS